MLWITVCTWKLKRSDFLKHLVNKNLTWENSRHLATLPLVSPPNDVWETRAEIPYWRRVTTQIRVVLLIGWIEFPTRYDQSEALPRSGYWRVISMEFLHSFNSQTSFGGETSGSVAKCRLFSRAIKNCVKPCLKKLKNTRRFDVLGRHYQVQKNIPYEWPINTRKQ